MINDLMLRLLSQRLKVSNKAWLKLGVHSLGV